MKVLVIGPNSQVGFSVLFYLTHFYGIDAMGYTRNEKNNSFFDALRLKHHKYINNNEKKKLFFKQFDIILDFIYPSCDFEDVLNSYNNHLKEILPYIPGEVHYFSFSSIMASPFGLGIFNYNSSGIPKTVYGYLKYMCEKIILNYRLNKISIIRLGEVHGFLQACDVKYQESYRFHSEIRVNSKGKRSNVLFISDICEYVIENYKNISNGLLVNENLTKKIVLQYYSRKYSFKGKYLFVKQVNPNRKELIILILLQTIPGLMKRIRVVYRSKSIGTKQERSSPYFHFYNYNGIKFHTSVNKGIDHIKAVEIEMSNKYNELIKSCII